MGYRATDEEILKALQDNKWDLQKACDVLGFRYTWNLMFRVRMNDDLYSEYKANAPKIPKQHTTREEVIEAIRATKGNMALTAKMLGVSSSAIYQRFDRDPELKEMAVNERNLMIDIAETKLFQQVENGEFQAIRYFLNSQGKDRGWGESLSIEGRITVQPTFDFSKLTSDEMKTFEELYLKILPEGSIPQQWDKTINYIESGKTEVTIEDENTVEGVYSESEL